jgi:hypothetical protein
MLYFAVFQLTSGKDCRHALSQSVAVGTGSSRPGKGREEETMTRPRQLCWGIGMVSTPERFVSKV